ncbi:MAG TPA: carboxypeptidase regulatory-like domain-containing protein [Candidatus Omnitrophota bacterium]|nr:carboxypeptidase regulatory-like domain-containing protein [Candidatus Omnitrophota bacterium]
MKPTNLLFLACVAVFLATHTQAATITGLAKFEGEKPNLKEIKMDADPICSTHHSGPVYPQTIVLGENGELGNIFVRVIAGLPKTEYPAPQTEVVIDQKGCMYDPHVAGAMVGQTVKILNPDGTLHNVHALPKVNEEFNLAMPKFRTEVTKVFDKVEFMFPLKCDVHPWMGAWIAIMDNPYFATTGADGKFTLNDLPAGEYELEAWHEKLGTQTAKVTLAEGESKEVNFSFSKPSK